MRRDKKKKKNLKQVKPHLEPLKQFSELKFFFSVLWTFINLKYIPCNEQEYNIGNASAT